MRTPRVGRACQSPASPTDPERWTVSTRLGLSMVLHTSTRRTEISQHRLDGWHAVDRAATEPRQLCPDETQRPPHWDVGAHLPEFASHRSDLLNQPLDETRLIPAADVSFSTRGPPRPPDRRTKSAPRWVFASMTQLRRRIRRRK